MNTVSGPRKTLRPSRWLAVTWLAAAVLAHAEGVTDFGSANPSADDFARALGGSSEAPAAAEGPKFRGIRPVAAPPISTAKASASAVSMQLTFAFNSDQLSSSARRTLNNLGQALQSEALRDRSFRIEGHTDSRGDDTYNQHLSGRRARSVVRYLAHQFGIPAARLQGVGKGESDPLYPNDPENPANRRVQIVKLGS